MAGLGIGGMSGVVREAILHGGDPSLLAAAGYMPGATVVEKFGSRDGVGSGAFEPIWRQATTYPFQTSAQSLEVVSDNAVDDDGNTGAWTVTVEGLDANWAIQTDTKTMDGTNAVALDGTWIRVNRAYVATAGTGTVNAGNITVQVAGAGAVLAQIAATFGQTTQAIYSVPAGKTLYLLDWELSTGKGDEIDIRGRFRLFGGAWRIGREALVYQGSKIARLLATPMPAKTDLVVEGKNVSGASSKVRVDFGGVLIDD